MTMHHFSGNLEKEGTTASNQERDHLRDLMLLGMLEGLCLCHMYKSLNADMNLKKQKDYLLHVLQ